jgi:hypothetical protein
LRVLTTAYCVAISGLGSLFVMEELYMLTSRSLVVCPWSHGVPQLFWLYAPYSKFAIPSSCGKVALWQQYA